MDGNSSPVWELIVPIRFLVSTECVNTWVGRRAMAARRTRRMSSSVLPANMGPAITSIRPASTCISYPSGVTVGVGASGVTVGVGTSTVGDGGTGVEVGGRGVAVGEGGIGVLEGSGTGVSVARITTTSVAVGRGVFVGFGVGRGVLVGVDVGVVEPPSTVLVTKNAARPMAIARASAPAASHAVLQRLGGGIVATAVEVRFCGT